MSSMRHDDRDDSGQTQPRTAFLRDDLRAYERQVTLSIALRMPLADDGGTLCISSCSRSSPDGESTPTSLALSDTTTPTPSRDGYDASNDSRSSSGGESPPSEWIGESRSLLGNSLSDRSRLPGCQLHIVTRTMACMTALEMMRKGASVPSASCERKSDTTKSVPVALPATLASSLRASLRLTPVAVGGGIVRGVQLSLDAVAQGLQRLRAIHLDDDADAHERKRAIASVNSQQGEAAVSAEVDPAAPNGCSARSTAMPLSPLRSSYGSYASHLFFLLLHLTGLQRAIVKLVVEFTGALSTPYPWHRLPNTMDDGPPGEANNGTRHATSGRAAAIDVLSVRALSVNPSSGWRQWMPGHSSSPRRPDTVTFAFCGGTLRCVDIEVVNAAARRATARSTRETDSNRCVSHPDGAAAWEMAAREAARREDEEHAQNFIIGIGLLPPLPPRVALPVRATFGSMWHTNVSAADAPACSASVTASLCGQQFLYFQVTPTAVNFVGPRLVATVVKPIAGATRTWTCAGQPDAAAEATVRLDEIRCGWTQRSISQAQAP